MQKFLDYLKQTPFWALTALKTAVCGYWVYVGVLACIDFFRHAKTERSFLDQHFTFLSVSCYIGLSLFFSFKLKQKYLWLITLFVAIECVLWLFEIYAWQKGGILCYSVEIGVKKMPAKLLWRN